MDRDTIAARLAVRRWELCLIEERLVAACEQAAGRRQPQRRLPPDRGAWDRATWDSYLREAVHQERMLGPTMQRLLNEIAHLEQIFATRTLVA